MIDNNKRLYNKFRCRARGIQKKVQNRIDREGPYENAGQKEISDFMDRVRMSPLHYTQQSELSDYINGLIDNGLVYVRREQKKP